MRAAVLFLLLSAVLPALACSPARTEGEGSSVISREAFVEAFVRLREGALRSPGEEMPVEERDRILADLGLVDQDLLDFVEVRGREVQFMRRVWEEVDSIITEMRQLPKPPDQRGL